MTPEEKATDLLNKFMELTSDWHEIDGFVPNKITAKKCALVAVDEILNIKGNLNFDYAWCEQRQTDIHNWYDTQSMITVRINALEYWQQVKEEIEKR